MADSKIIFAAIDLGTSFSGWAFALRTDPDTMPNIFVKSWYSAYTAHATGKTPTCVLIKPDGESLEAFGYDAETKYNELVSKRLHDTYFYFKNFKTGLYGKYYQPLNMGMTLVDEMGKTLPAINVFSSSIRYLADDMYTQLEKSFQDIRREDIRWVITVPAIWTDQAKYLMRESAIKAGMKSDSLIMALEPEAASIYCRQLDLRAINRETGVALASLEVGSKYLVLDAGGGTIDLTIHEVDSSKCVKQIVVSSGNVSGGNAVNREFERFLKEAISDDKYQQFKRNQTEDWLYLMGDFEIKKKSFDPKKQDTIVLRFPLSLREVFETSKRQSLWRKSRKRKCIEEAVKDTSFGTDITIKRDKIIFTARDFSRFFQHSLEKTIKEIRKQLDKLHGEMVYCILMVGGFSECTLLQQEVISSFPFIPVNIPIEASTVVLKGAVVYGNNPPIISERVVKYTYGVSACNSFIADAHPVEKRLVTDTGVVCKDIFSKHVTRGELVKTGEPQRKECYLPQYRNQKSVKFDICASKLPNPRYTTDKDCHIIGTIEIQLTERDDARENTIIVSFAFGGTEIVVTAVEEETGKEIKTHVSFLE
ncbi:heat shock 70 kDa protein 12B-like isoform X2 [Mercenaria mercenaria]|uniref:heat shock 70 kDa protein 12B-like isoform X1 n=1 Tax=Mercenaria mercenaria TaxID=6596 RepID=UPI00234E3D8B|nr:heat shock 70 kDa protein 12B-like isoform X1 [Mercenaria mercenaria]XP_045203910.2 heat shock 70 kDa protein 12B-like isoform X2 [Mercenaria mercenaria]